MAKWFSGFGFAWAVHAAQCSFSVRAVTADSAIAASPAASKPDAISDGARIAATNKVRKDDSIIATGSANTVSAKPSGRFKAA